MALKYEIVLVVDGIDNFHTVMKAVENSKGVAVQSAGLSGAAPTRRTVVRTMKTNPLPGNRSHEVVLAELKTRAANFVDIEEVREILSRRGFAPGTSGHVMTILTKTGHVSLKERGVYAVNQGELS